VVRTALQEDVVTAVIHLVPYIQSARDALDALCRVLAPLACAGCCLDRLVFDGQALIRPPVIYSATQLGWGLTAVPSRRLPEPAASVSDQPEPGDAYWRATAGTPCRLGYRAYMRTSPLQTCYRNLSRKTSAILIASSEESRKMQTPIFTWLHVTDIHFGHGDATHGGNQKLVLRKLLEDLQQRSELDIPVPNAIFVTGDIAFSGAVKARDEYDRARDWQPRCSKRYVHKGPRHQAPGGSIAFRR